MGKIIDIFARNRLLVNIIIIITITFGLYCYFQMGKEAFPSTDFDALIIQVVYPGGSPKDIEQNAVIPIENELQTIPNIDEFSTTIIENAAIIVARIDMNVKDTRPTKDEIFRRMKNVPNVSENVTEINITEVNPKLLPIYNLAIRFKQGMKGDEKELYYFSKMLEKELKYVNGVANIRVSGRADPEIQILADPKKLENYYISLTDIVNSLKTRNIRSTSGILKKEGATKDKNKTLVTMGEFESVGEITNVIVRAMFNGKIIRIDDIAEVKETFVDKTSIMRVNQTEGYSVKIVKKEDADIIKTIKNVNKFLKENKDIIPSNIEIVTMGDNSRTINDLLNSVVQNLIGGFIIIVIILLVFLDLKSALFTALGMFIVMFVSIIFMYFSKISINTISLAAIITVLGMIVDNSIVVSENIFNYKQRGFVGLNATKNAVLEMILPMFISTLTTVVAFMPMLFITGTMGKLMGQYPKVVIVALLTSLFQAILILPNNILTRKEIEGGILESENNIIKNIKKKKHFLSYDRDKLFDKLKIPFIKILTFFLRFRYIVVSVFVIIFIASLFLAKSLFDKFTLVYDKSADTIVINIDSGVGSSLAKTQTYTKAIEDIIYKVVDKNDIVAVYSLIGQQLEKGAVDVVAEEMDNLAGTIVYLVPFNERKKVAYDIADELEKEIEKSKIRKELDLLSIYVKFPLNPGKAVDIKVVGNNEIYAKEVKEKLKAFILKQPGIINYDDDDKEGIEEIRVTFDYDKIASLGVNVALVSRELRTAYSGTVATSIQQFENRLDFRVMLDKKYKYDTATLNNILIPNAYNRLLYLKDIATIEITNSAASIKHFNSKKSITLTADIRQGENTTIQVTKSIENYFKIISKDYPGIILDFAGEIKETRGSISGLMNSLIIAIVAIYIVLLLQFKKFIEPILILIVIPFGTIGVFLAFFLHNVPMSFVGGIGIIGLSGVVVNNGIIMVDLINKIIHSEKNPSKENIQNAIITGSSNRFRAIFLTTITTIAGLMPTVYGIGGRADLIVPIVMAMAYGLIFASLLTLIMLPCLFMVAYDLKLIRVKKS